MNPPLVSVLIVNFRSGEHLRTCLDALRGATLRDQLEIIVVDNDPVTFDAAGFVTRYPDVCFLAQERNTTYTGGSNLAFEASTAKFLLLLNPDAAPEPQAIERAVEHLAADEGISAIAPLLLEGDGRPQRYYRRLPSLLDAPIVLFPALFRATPPGRRYLLADLVFERAAEVEQPPGAFLLLRRPVGKPLLDAGYFNYVSDVDLCDRLRKQGRIVMFPDVRCVHAKGAAGVRAARAADRLRLHHDLTWGVRRYFRSRCPGIRQAYVEAAILLFWMIRLVQEGVRSPRVLPRAIATAAAAIAGHPPNYD